VAVAAVAGGCSTRTDGQRPVESAAADPVLAFERDGAIWLLEDDWSTRRLTSGEMPESRRAGTELLRLGRREDTSRCSER
jgi:hypothetical protein